MKTKEKHSGFFVIEVLVVLLLVAILTLMLLPNYKTYVDRAKFAEVMRVAESLKTPVEACAYKVGADKFAEQCVTGQNGIPSQSMLGALYNGKGHMATTDAVLMGGTGAAGVIAARASDGIGNAREFYILTPTVQNISTTDESGSGMIITWAESGSCVERGLC